jgi:hypothetical protein
VRLARLDRLGAQLVARDKLVDFSHKVGVIKFAA